MFNPNKSFTPETSRNRNKRDRLNTPETLSIFYEDAESHEKKIKKEYTTLIKIKGSYVLIKSTTEFEDDTKQEKFIWMLKIELDPAYRLALGDTSLLNKKIDNTQSDFVDLTANAKKDLTKLEIEINPENIETAINLRSVRQLPEAPKNKEKEFDELYSVLNEYNQNPSKEKEEALIMAMNDAGIKSIVHSEGLTVWEHTKKTIQEINKLNIEAKLKKELRIVMLYHDLGKGTVWNNKKNQTKTQQKLEQGIIHQTMIGHEKAETENIKRSLQANNIVGDDLNKNMLVILHHMDTELMQQEPTTLYKKVQKFSKNEKVIKDILQSLVLVLKVNGQGIDKIELIDKEKIIFSKNRKNDNLSFKKLWQAYKQGKQIATREMKSKAAEVEQIKFEKLICGDKLSTYLIKTKGIKAGPKLGTIIEQAKEIIKNNKQLPVKKIKVILDQTKFK